MELICLSSFTTAGHLHNNDVRYYFSSKTEPKVSMHNKNTKESKMEPCGTPQEMGEEEEYTLPV